MRRSCHGGNLRSVTHVGACALRRHQGSFTSKVASAQVAREHRGGRDDPVLQQPSREFGHGDRRLGLDGLDQEGLMGRRSAAFAARA